MDSGNAETQIEKRLAPTEENVQSRTQSPLQTEPLRNARLPHLEGWRLWVVVACLCGGLLISSLEVTIIGTALLSIASDFKAYDKSSWVVSAYLATYSGFVVIFSRCSDIFGRRSTWLAALGFFVLASVACGAAQTINQLIVFRAFQGIGGAGLYALAIGTATEVPGKLRAPINGLLSSVFAMSSAIGPIVGGAIASTTTWRWVFLINVPIGAVVALVSFFIFPKNPFPLSYGPRSLRRFDLLGAILSIAGIETLMVAMQTGGINFAWHSAPIAVLFALSACCWVGFFLWEWYLSTRRERFTALPLWPTDIFFHRVIGNGMLSAFLGGVGFIAVIVYLPQRFQIQNGDSAILAGVRMLAYLVLSSFAAGVAAVIAIFKNVLFPMLIFGCALQLLGLALLSVLPTTEAIASSQYGYQIILGVGFGIGLSILPLITRMEVTRINHAINMGAVTQSRLMGAVIGIGMGEIVITSRVWARLPAVVTPQEYGLILRSVENIRHLEPAKQIAVESLYGDAINLIFRISMYICIGALLAATFCYKVNPQSVAEMEKVEAEVAARETMTPERGRDLEVSSSETSTTIHED